MVLGQNLDQIRPIVKKVKENTWRLHGEYLLKQKIVLVQILEWKFKANIARNATFEGCLGSNFCSVWVKNGRKLDIYFQEFHFS